MWDKAATAMLKKARVKIGEDIIVHDTSAYKDMILRGSLGLGESYIRGKWDSPHLDALITKLLSSNLERYRILGAGAYIALAFQSKLVNLQGRRYAPDLFETHYNSGNHLFESFLDPDMIYTCAYFKRTDDLHKAQLDKIRIIGEKLKLKLGERVLDIGCGWGGTARILSEMFDVHVTGVADAPNQIDYANRKNKRKNVRFIKADYRDITGTYDKIYNVGFLEAVGPKNLRGFMQLADRLLKDDGIFLTHTIGGRDSTSATDPWIDKYIFPHGVIPSKRQIDMSARGIFVERDFEAFGKYYDKTLLNWNRRFNQNWHRIKDRYKHPNQFKRMMNYYFLVCAATFRTGKNDLWQIVHTKPGRVPDYAPYRLK
jgi:cyclopropane-fatty-acyl-phospholipid synthase